MAEDLIQFINLGVRLGLYGEAKAHGLRHTTDPELMNSAVSELLPNMTGTRVTLVELVGRTDLNGQCGTIASLPRDRSRLQALVTDGRVAILLDAGGKGIQVRVTNMVLAAAPPRVQHALAQTGKACRGLDAARAWAKSAGGADTDPDGGDVAVLRAVLSTAEVAEMIQLAESHGAARRRDQRLCGVGGDGTSPAAHRPCDELNSDAHDVCFSNEHTVLYLHHDSYLQQQHPRLWAKLLGTMRVVRPVDAVASALHRVPSVLRRRWPPAARAPRSRLHAHNVRVALRSGWLCWR
jgi:hypothetical protein